MIYLFSTDDCIPCSEVKKYIHNITQKHELGLKIIDPTEEIELAQKYDVKILPTFVFRGDNKQDEVNMVIEGFIDKDDFEDIILNLWEE